MAFIRVDMRAELNKTFNVYEKDKFCLFWELMSIYLTQKNYTSEFSKLICSNVNNLLNASDDAKSVIVYGEVQSGKTNNVIFLTTALFDLDYDIVIFIGGTNKLLLDQNKGRFEEFRDIFRSKKNINIFNFTASKSSMLISRVDGIIEYGGKLIINILKEEKNMLAFLMGLMTTGVSGKTFFHKKVAIIDDECDNASSPSFKCKPVIYEKINKIIANGPFIKYFGVSATPYANIVNKNNDEIYPKKVVVLNSSGDYCGLNYFHNGLKNKWIKNVENTKATFVTKENLDNIIYYIVKFLYLLLLKNENVKVQSQSGEMIFNISQDTSTHHNVAEEIGKLVARLSGFNPSRFFEIIDKYLDKDINELKKEQKFTMFKYLIGIYKNKSVIELNSSGINKYESNGIKILVGGVLLGRGFTFNNLLLTAIFNVPANVAVISGDVMLQRARWFGYRKQLSEFMNIYMNKTTSLFYEKMKIVDELIRKYYIENNFVNDENAANYVRAVFLQNGLKVPEK